MTSFLVRWDAALWLAQRYGQPEFMWRSWCDDNGDFNLKPVARTMHPSFMSGPIPPKYDPERDQ